MSYQNITYACGSPIRQKLMFAVSKGFDSDLFNPFPTPEYLGGDAIVWGLIRGAKELMAKAIASGANFYQIDNGYFGRNQYFRITKNGVQKTQITKTCGARSARVLQECGITLNKDHKNKRGSKILVALSSEHLYAFHGQTSKDWLISTIESITQFSDREIIIRSKNSNKPLAEELKEAWCVVTHSSAVALDALQLNIPVICTAGCAATPLSMSLSDIESPLIRGNVEELFLSLADSQFTCAEYHNGVFRASMALDNSHFEWPSPTISLASKNYIAEQIELHKRPSYGSTSRLFAREVAELILKTGSESLLDFGAGKCRLRHELAALGINIAYQPYDIAFPEYGQPTAKDFVTCIDVLEHIEPDYLDDVLNELHRCTKKFLFVTVHTGPARKFLADGRNAHLIQKPWSWWEKCLSTRFKVLSKSTRSDGFACCLAPRSITPHHFESVSGKNPLQKEVASPYNFPSTLMDRR